MDVDNDVKDTLDDLIMEVEALCEMDVPNQQQLQDRQVEKMEVATVSPAPVNIVQQDIPSSSTSGSSSGQAPSVPVIQRAKTAKISSRASRKSASDKVVKKRKRQISSSSSSSSSSSTSSGSSVASLAARAKRQALQSRSGIGKGDDRARYYKKPSQRSTKSTRSFATEANVVPWDRNKPFQQYRNLPVTATAATIVRALVKIIRSSISEQQAREKVVDAIKRMLRNIQIAHGREFVLVPHHDSASNISFELPIDAFRLIRRFLLSVMLYASLKRFVLKNMMLIATVIRELRAL